MEEQAEGVVLLGHPLGTSLAPLSLPGRTTGLEGPLCSPSAGPLGAPFPDMGSSKSRHPSVYGKAGFAGEQQLDTVYHP